MSSELCSAPPGRAGRVELDAVFRAVHPRLLAYAHEALRVSLANREWSALDIVQFAYLRAWPKVDHLRARSETDVYRWMRAFVLNEIRNRSRRCDRERRARQPIDDLDELPSRELEPLARCVARERRALLNTALSRLSPLERGMLRRVAIDGSSMRAAGRCFDLGPDTARRCFLRARARLRCALAELTPRDHGLDDEP